MIKHSFLYIFILFLYSCSSSEGNKVNLKQDQVLLIPKHAHYKQVLDSLKNKIIDLNSFDDYANYKDYESEIKAGRYILKKGFTNSDIIEKITKGKEDEVPVLISNEPTIFHLAKSVSKKITADSSEIVESILKNPIIASKNLDLESSKIYFTPNTYNFLWITSAEQFVNRMIKEHDKFWDKNRLALLEKSGMTELEVITLASIVQMESSKKDEQPRVARAYLNRLKKGKRLQADPTSVYAWKLENGFSEQVQRVYHKHLKTASAYNTYKITGLPPAPICLPNPSAIDAVLSPADHDFIYFVANPDRPGYHSFTNSYTEHMQNAKKYRLWLKENNIK